jgi:hypothetical protein
MPENKISVEMAEQEFERFGEAMDLDFDMSFMDEEDRKGFEQAKRRIVKAIMSGAMLINEEGCPVFTPQRAGGDVNPITFYEPTGATYMAMDRKKKTEDMGKMMALMADYTQTSAGLFAKMKNADFKICLAVTTLFLG